jgi:GT2 family glycosyltransferase
MSNVFVIILNWNRAKDTIECLESVGGLRVTSYVLSVVVVDNGSKKKNLIDLEKGIKSIKSTKDIKGFKLIKNQKNLGFAGGMNSGIKYALDNNADYVAVLNNDTILDEKLIVGLLETAKEHPKAGVICPKIYFAKGFEFHKGRYKKSELGKVVWYAGGDIDWNNVYGMNRGVDEVDKGQYDEVRETDFATGNCMFLNAKALNEARLFDEKYFMYLEDVDLCMRFKKAGWEVLYSPKGILWHKVAQSTRIGSDLNDYFIHRNRMLFGILYAPLRAKIALIKESWKFLINGRKWQKIGIRDFYLGRFGKGSWVDN